MCVCVCVCVCVCAGTVATLGLSVGVAEFMSQDLGPFASISSWVAVMLLGCVYCTHTHTHTHARTAVSQSGCVIYDTIMPLGCECLSMWRMMSPDCECNGFCGCL